MYSWADQSPRSISLTTKTSMYPNLVVPPHSGEKPMNKVREAGKVILVSKAVMLRQHCAGHPFRTDSNFFQSPP